MYERLCIDTAVRQPNGNLLFTGSPGWVTPTTSQEPVFSVLDVETTGFSKTDRMIEMAIVRVCGLKIVSKWATLLACSRRNLGPSHVHRIYPKHLVGAPQFQTVIGDIFHQLEGTYLVAHVKGFDIRFLKQETAICGVDIDQITWNALDTQSFAPLFGAPSKKLCDIAKAAGVQLLNHHAALPDTVATAEVFIEAQKRQPITGLGAPFAGPTDLPEASGKALVRV